MSAHVPWPLRPVENPAPPVSVCPGCHDVVTGDVSPPPPDIATTTATTTTIAATTDATNRRCPRRARAMPVSHPRAVSRAVVSLDAPASAAATRAATIRSGGSTMPNRSSSSKSSTSTLTFLVIHFGVAFETAPHNRAGSMKTISNRARRNVQHPGNRRRAHPLPRHQQQRLALIIRKRRDRVHEIRPAFVHVDVFFKLRPRIADRDGQERRCLRHLAPVSVQDVSSDAVEPGSRVLVVWIEVRTTAKRSKPHLGDKIVRGVASRATSQIRVNRSVVAPEEFAEHFGVPVRRTSNDLSVTLVHVGPSPRPTSLLFARAENVRSYYFAARTGVATPGLRPTRRIHDANVASSNSQLWDNH